MSEIATGQDGPVDDLFSGHRTHIAQLALGQQEQGPSPYVEAIVSLVWPYSHREGLLSLLLAEPDVRLRSAKGQLKVTFHGSAAREVAKSQVGIGDTVRLRLEGAKWTDTGDAVLTPGKKVEWDLHFKKTVTLDVTRDGKCLATFNYEGTDTPPPTEEALPNQTVKSLQVNGYHDDALIVFSTPASTKPKRLSSGSFIDASLDPFADDDGFVLGKGRKRTRFGRISASWRLVDDEQVGKHEEEDTLPQNTERDAPGPTAETSGPSAVITVDVDSSERPSSVEATMPPPLTPFRPAPERPQKASFGTSIAATPRLHPLMSPGLPLVSPLAKTVGASVGYFAAQASGASELDAISVSSTSPQVGNTKEPAKEINVDETSQETKMQTTGEAEWLLRGMRPASISSDINEGTSTDLEVQPTAFDKPAAALPLDSVSGANAGFGFQLGSALSSPVFGTSTNPSTFAAPSTLIGSATGFASFAYPFDSGLSRGVEMGVGLDLGMPAESTTGWSPAEWYDGLESKAILDDSIEQREQEQDEGRGTDEQLLKSTAMQADMVDFRRERSKTPDSDDDMYGPARPVQRSPSERSLASGTSGSEHNIWKERLNVTAVDIEISDVPTPPFPFLKEWEEKRQSDRRQSQQSSSPDGVNDEASEPDGYAEALPGSESSQTLSEEVRVSEPVTLITVDAAQVTPAMGLEMVPNFERITEAQIAIGPILDLEGRVESHGQIELQSPHTVSDDENFEQTASTSQAHEELRVCPPADQFTTSEASTHDEAMEEDLNPQFVARDQFLTPENTQQDVQDGYDAELLRQVPSLQMPPTPDNTQEPTNVGTLNLDGTDDFRPDDEEMDIVKVSLRAQREEDKTSFHPPHKALNVSAVSSPYFTPRIAAPTSPQRDMATTDRSHDDEEPDVMELIHQSTPDITNDECQLRTVEVEAEAEVVIPHDKLLHNMLGMATPLSYYTPLSNLDEHYNQQVDVLAICTSSSGIPTRSKGGPKDYCVTLHLVDFFLDGATTVTAQLFRPYDTALPALERGEVMLLRSFKVQSQKHKMMLLSTESSAWAVFSASDVSAKDVEYWDLQIDVRGPPVEYGSEEYVYAKRLMEWWDASGRDAHPDLAAKKRDDTDRQHIDPPRDTRSSVLIENRKDHTENSNAKEADSEALRPNLKPKGPQISQSLGRKTNGEVPGDQQPTSPIRPTRSSRRAAQRTDMIGNEDDSATADSIEPLPEISSPKTGRRTRRSTSVLSITPELSRLIRAQGTVHELRDGTKYVDGYVPSKNDVVHELRDGTKYVDENTSPSGRTTSVRAESVVHELRDGTKYVDRSTSPEVRRSARNKRGASVVYEL